MNFFADLVNKELDKKFKMNTVVINGRSISVQGNNISVVNDKIYVDGKLVESGLSGNVNVQFVGDLANLECNTCEITGNVQGNVKSNTVKISGSVGGDVKANTVKCGDVAGKVKGNTVKTGNKSEEGKWHI